MKTTLIAAIVIITVIIGIGIILLGIWISRLLHVL